MKRKSRKGAGVVEDGIITNENILPAFKASGLTRELTSNE
jgi:hypothetical protein